MRVRKLLSVGVIGCAVVGSLAAIGWAADGDAAGPGGKRKAKHDNQQAVELFSQLDKNQDGQLTADEVSDEHRRLFDRLLRTSDANQDGQLSRDEFSSGMKSRRPKRPEAEAARAGAERPRFDPARLVERFNEMDKNGNGSIELDEVPEGRLQGLFERLIEHFDKDGVAGLSREELQAAGRALADRFGRDQRRPGPQQGAPGGPAPEGDALVRRLDTDKDGNLSSAEIEAAPKVLAQLDKDGDGQLSRRELMALGGGSAGGPRPFGRPSEQARRFDPQRLVGRIMQADQNGDGKISRDEAPERLKERFDNIDANGDGLIDAEELKTQLAKMAQRAGRTPRGPRPGSPPGERPL